MKQISDFLLLSTCAHYTIRHFPIDHCCLACTARDHSRNFYTVLLQKKKSLIQAQQNDPEEMQVPSSPKAKLLCDQAAIYLAHTTVSPPFFCRKQAFLLQQQLRSLASVSRHAMHYKPACQFQRCHIQWKRGKSCSDQSLLIGCDVSLQLKIGKQILSLYL